MDAGAPATSRLLLTICPHCGYSLEGSPPEGICPECGNPYDQSAIILHGWGCGQHARFENATPGGMVLIVVSVAANGMTLWQLKWSSWGSLALVYLAFGGALMLSRRYSGAAPGLVRVRLDPAGCAQDDTPGDTPFLTALLNLWLLLGLGLPLGLAVVFAWRGGGLWYSTLLIPLMISFSLLSALVPRLGAARREIADRYATTSEADGAGRLRRMARLALSRRVAMSPTGWGDVSEVKVEPVLFRKLGRYRVHCQKKAKSFWRPRPDPIDAEVEMTPAQALELRRQIGEWRRIASAT